MPEPRARTVGCEWPFIGLNRRRESLPQSRLTPNTASVNLTSLPWSFSGDTRSGRGLKNSPWAGLALGFVAEMVPELGSEGAVIVVDLDKALPGEEDDAGRGDRGSGSARRRRSPGGAVAATVIWAGATRSDGQARAGLIPPHPPPCAFGFRGQATTWTGAPRPLGVGGSRAAPQRAEAAISRACRRCRAWGPGASPLVPWRPSPCPGRRGFCPVSV